MILVISKTFYNFRLKVIVAFVMVSGISGLVRIFLDRMII